MHNIEQEFQKLKELILASHGGERIDPWLIYHQTWRYYHYMNENIQKAKSMEEQVAVIEQFINLNKSQEQSFQQIAKDTAKADLPLEEVLEPKLKEMITLMREEREVFNKNLRRIKRQKTQKKPTKANSDRSKWLRS